MEDSVAKIPFIALEEANYRADKAERKTVAILYVCIGIISSLLVGTIYHTRRMHGINNGCSEKRTGASD